MSRPKKLSAPDGIERRSFPLLNLRQKNDTGEAPKLVGYAAVFNQETVLIPRDAMWAGSPEVREVIEPGAFTKTIAEGDIRAVWNHNTDIVLGRTRNKTLKLWEDANGLGNEIEPPATALVRDMVFSPIDRGDVDQMSIGFWIIREDEEKRDNGAILVFRIKEVKLMEVSPVAIPAYPQTSISARSMERIEDYFEEFRQLRQAAESSPAPGQAAHPDGSEHLESTPADEHPETIVPAPPDTRHLDEDLFRRLDIVKVTIRPAA